tara:strand:- start:2536 stop:3285 length:750 start_codon:yes stop_codon:yes gene_type:complete
MVNIDNVYQKVLSLANKEQRGYITPQEFNLFANQAQMEIFEQYFYDLNQFSRGHDNDTAHSGMIRILEEKIGEFERAVGSTYIITNWGFMNKPSNIRLPVDLYRISRVSIDADFKLAERLNRNDWNEVRRIPYLAPTSERPVWNVRRGILRINKGDLGSAGEPVNIDPNTTQVGVHWVQTPPTVRWGYVVISEKAMFDPSTTTHFNFHPSEETDLVYKILKYAGVSMDKDSIMRAGQGMEMAKISQEKQ